MTHSARIWEKDGFVLRLAQKEDAIEYYEHNFNPLDRETARLTGCKSHFTRDEVIHFFQECIASPDRYDFLILSAFLLNRSSDLDSYYRRKRTQRNRS